MTRQDEILKYLVTVDSATISEIYENVSFSYYHNWNKHLSALLSLMVKSGRIDRISKGNFSISYKAKGVKQVTLF